MSWLKQFEWMRQPLDAIYCSGEGEQIGPHEFRVCPAPVVFVYDEDDHCFHFCKEHGDELTAMMESKK